MSHGAVDILVRTQDPEALDKVLEMLPGAFARVVGVGMPEGPRVVDGCHVVRALTGADFVEHALRSQGYAEVVRRLETLL